MNLTEVLIGAAINNPLAQFTRSGSKLAGRLIPGLGPVVDSADNAIRAMSGDRRNVDPSSYTPESKTLLASAIDKAYQGSDKKVGEFVDVQYGDYSPTGNPDDKNLASYVAGAMMARKLPDGTYEIKPDERYDFNAAHVPNEKRSEYLQNLNTATSDAVKRKDLPAFLANIPDHIAFHTGAGGKGMTIGGKFSVPNQPKMSSSSTDLVDNPAVVDAPALTYTVSAGDTLSSIARANNISVDELARKNDIANPNLISIGQSLITG